MSENDTVTPAAPQPQPPPAATPSETDERTWALLGHLSAFSAFITGLGCVIGPLIVWLVKRDTMPFAGEQAKEALNFNITVAIVYCVLGLFSLLTFGLGLLLAWPVGVIVFIAWVVLTIIAAIKANEGVAYRYPFALRLIK